MAGIPSVVETWVKITPWMQKHLNEVGDAHSLCYLMELHTINVTFFFFSFVKCEIEASNSRSVLKEGLKRKLVMNNCRWCLT